MATAAVSSFRDEALQSAEAFRIMMEAMARPGNIIKILKGAQGVHTMNPGATMVADTLCDHETSVWLAPTLNKAPVIDFLKFRTGCSISEEKKLASFAFFDCEPDISDFDHFSKGEASYPDRSATLVIQVQELNDAGAITLTGPGIRTNNRLGVVGLGDGFWAWWRTNTAKFPLGLDVMLAGEDCLAALPRSVKAQESS